MTEVRVRTCTGRQQQPGETDHATPDMDSKDNNDCEGGKSCSCFCSPYHAPPRGAGKHVSWWHIGDGLEVTIIGRGGLGGLGGGKQSPSGVE